MVTVSMRPQFLGSCGGATGPASQRIGSVRPKLAQERALALGARFQRQHAGADVGGVQEHLAHGERAALRVQVLDGVGADGERLAHVEDALEVGAAGFHLGDGERLEDGTELEGAAGETIGKRGSSQSAGREGSAWGSETAARTSPELASSTRPAAPDAE